MRRLRPSRAFWSYLLLQLPDVLLAGLALWLLHRFAILSAGWAVGVFAAWVAKDLAMYPVVRSALQPPRWRAESLVDARGIVRTPLSPRGQVRIGGELWQAEPLGAGAALPPGTAVVVRAMRGLTLLVEPAEGGMPPAAERPERLPPERPGPH
jgi:membrane protein implicated in regulation of membrane protease activity